MSETPQSDAVESEITEQPVTTNDSVVESDTTSQVQAESNEQVDEVQLAKDKANDAFNKQYGEKMQAKRERDDALAKVAGFEKTDRERQAAAVGTLPELLDPLDDGYEESVVNWKKAVQTQANYNADNSAYIKQQNFNQQQVAQAAQIETQKLVNGFMGNARKAGASDTEISTVIATLNNDGMTSNLGDAIMADPDGYFIAKHLAANPMEHHELNTMNPILAGAKFAEIKAKASALKPKTSNTPAPADTLSGNGVDPDGKKHPALQGVIYD